MTEAAATFEYMRAAFVMIDTNGFVHYKWANPPRTFPNVVACIGPHTMVKREGRIQIVMARVPNAVPEYAGQWFASADGWGLLVVGISPNREELERYCRKRFRGCDIREAGDE